MSRQKMETYIDSIVDVLKEEDKKIEEHECDGSVDCDCVKSEELEKKIEEDSAEDDAERKASSGISELGEESILDVIKQTISEDIETEFQMGMKDEMEHLDSVDGDLSKIEKIVLDHLQSDPEYYSKLRQAGLMEDIATKPSIEHKPDGNLTPIGWTLNGLSPKRADILVDKDINGTQYRICFQYSTGEVMIVPPVGTPGVMSVDALVGALEGADEHILSVANDAIVRGMGL